MSTATLTRNAKPLNFVVERRKLPPRPVRFNRHEQSKEYRLIYIHKEEDNVVPVMIVREAI